MNNLYGWRMSIYLPYDRFKWLQKRDDGFDLPLIAKKSRIGYILKIDLKYTDKLHE